MDDDEMNEAKVRGPLLRLGVVMLASGILYFSGMGAALAVFTPPKNLDPAASTITLDSSFQSDAWLVYTYSIGPDGKVVDATIQSSNGVREVEEEVLRQVNAMRFSPAKRDDVPVQVSADPVIFTWILDTPRAMTPLFEEMYLDAWTKFRDGDYDGAFDLAVQLKSFPGRNSFEEVKFQILAASLFNRWEDSAAELQHLSRIVELQSLADANNFQNPYVEGEQYLQILSRIQALQLERMMLADAGDTLVKIHARGAGSQIVLDAATQYAQAEKAFKARPDVTVAGELLPIYRGGPGGWKTGLSRVDFSISDVKGRIGAVFLTCKQGEIQLRYPSNQNWRVPAGWGGCKIDVSGKAGSRFILHQYAPGQG
jgi:TonB family protein